MGCAVFVPDMDSVLSLVLRKTVVADCGLYLDPRHATATAHGPVNEFCVAIYAAHDADQCIRRRRLAFYAWGSGALAGLRGDTGHSSHPAKPRPEARQKV